ncbi:UDP-N-acetylmuramoyl-L-alanine--D-glutamate ligase [Pontibacterium sp.]|uniref:UDP-N-acetylmuramoyl-L-alanine--D-glutamate ligase n=1 Tax=Pontibacterium sp. TaxID=2036026 RepID=UPI0035113C1B
MSLIASDNRRIIIGLGATGISCARHLARKGVPFAVVDTRENPAGLEDFKADFPDVDVRCGELDAEYLAQATELIVSPGVAISHPAIQTAAEKGVHLCGDIDLFIREITAPVIAITGSNAKSTVTTLVGEMAAAAGIDVGVGGNLGTPVLDMLAKGEQALYVLELSSFQLETCHDLRAKVATVLNISPDHQDRYPDMQAYYQAKHRIFRGCSHAVVNRDDALTSPLLPKGVTTSAFHLGRPDLNLFGVARDEAGTEWLAVGQDKLLPVSELKIRGQHNVANALAALALGQAAGLPLEAMLDALRVFGGLKHRCQWVADKAGISYFNDSKGTNVGATVAALDGLGPTLDDAKIVLIAGGDGKGAEFADLAAPVARYGRAVVLIGTDAPRIREAVGSIECRDASDMEEAVKLASELAEEGDIVLLSPACASFDMFKNFNVRGDMFIAAVEKL